MTSASQNTRIIRTIGAVLCLLAFGVQAADCTNPRKATGAMSEPFYRGIEQATGLISKSKYDEAIAQLAKMTESGEGYEKAVAAYNLGFAYNGKGDYQNAAKSFQKALDQNALPQAQQEQLQYNTGQLYILNKQYDQGIHLLEQYMAESCSPITADAHIFLASAYSERKDFRKALAQVDLAIAKAKQPKEAWLQLKLAINYESKDFKACAETLVKLIGMVPAKPDYWKQLSGMFFELKDDQEALATLVLAQRQGFIDKPNEIKNLYNIYMLVDLPFKAGLLMQEAIDKNKLPADEKNLDSLANAWINARELPRAETTLKKLAQMSDKGDYYFKLGAMYGDDERWKESREMLQLALQKGGLKHTGEAWMRIAVAAYNLKDLSTAESALQKAMAYDETRKEAGQWLQHIRAETAQAG